MTDLDPRWGVPSFAHDPHLLAGFKPRPTDVLITTAPKAGTTWMQQILHQLRTGGDDNFASIFEAVPWLELPRRGQTHEQTLAQYAAMGDPRVFKTHCTYPQTPGADTARIVLSSRDPRDCCVSMYHHRMDMTDEAVQSDGLPPKPQTFEDFFENWMAFGSWFRNVESWWPHRNDANVLWVTYDEMKDDLAMVMDRLLVFLGWERSPLQRARALELSGFDWMKRNESRFTRLSKDRPSAFKPGGFIRKGVVGDHKTLLSPQHEKRILDEARRRLPADCLAFHGLA